MSELSQEARALIDGVSTLDDPSADDRARIRSRLAMQLGAAAFSAAGVTNAGGVSGKTVAASKSGLFGMAGKAALCAGALCAAGTIWLLDWHAAPSVQHARPAPVNASRVQEAAPPLVVPPAVAAQPVVEAMAEPVALPNQTRLRRKAATSAVVADEADPATSLAAELSLLGRAQAALRARNPSQALALVREHEATFPDGIMKEERLGVAALSGCALLPAGSSADGAERERALAFLKAAPSSPLAARLRKACGLQ